MRRFACIILVLMFSPLNSLVCQTDSLLLLSPYHVIETHLSNLQHDNYFPEKSAKAIHASIVDENKREEMAERLKKIYDAKGLFVEMSKIPKNPFYKDSLSGNEVYVPFPERLPQVYVEKNNGVWTYSAETSKSIERLYNGVFPFKLGKIIDKMPQGMQKEFFGIKAWQYIGFFIILGLAYLLHLLLNFAIDRLILSARWYKEMNLESASRPVLHKFVGYGLAVFLISAIRFLIPSILLDISISKVLYILLDLIQTVFVMLCLFKFVSLINIYLKGVTAKTASKLDDQLLPVLIKISKMIVAVVAGIHVLAIAGVNVTALIAGVSIGGLALALAAQDTVKNFLGSIMIFFDKPFQIGDYILTPELEGTVEEVGFRSTRLRKIDTSLVSIPNGNLSNVTLTNLGVRKLRLLEVYLNLKYDTRAENMQTFIADIRSYVENHVKIDPVQRMVYFRNMSSSSLDIFVRVFIITNDIVDELSTRQEILFEIMKLARNNSVEFAYPSTSVYIEQNGSQKVKP